jgi:hypothetical protein
MQFLLRSIAELILGHGGTTKYVEQNTSYFMTLNLNDRSKLRFPNFRTDPKR